MSKIIDFQNSELFKKRYENSIEIPLYEHRIPAGTPTSIFDDSVEKIISLDLFKA